MNAGLSILCAKRSAITAGVISSVLFGIILVAPSANAEDISDSGVSTSVDITLTHGLTFRTSKRDETLTSLNSDDGNLNYGRGVVSNTSSVSFEFEANDDNLRFFARSHGFVDFTNQNSARARTPLTDKAKGITGRDFKILDFYASGAFEPNGIPLNVRLGRQVLNWGESTFYQNGINVINPFDVSRLRTAGSELKDALVPIWMISASIQPTVNLSIEGFYQFKWEKTEIDPPGTFFSTSDYVGAGGRYAFLSGGAIQGVSDTGRNFGALAQAINTDLSAYSSANANDRLRPRCSRSGRVFSGEDCQAGLDPYFLALQRTEDREADDSGQWGFALRYFAEELNNTEFGLYFSNVHSRLPIVSGVVANRAEMLRSAKMASIISATGPPASRTVQALIRTFGAAAPAEIARLAGALATDRFAKSSNYFLEYPKNLKTIGLSFNTSLGTTGWALQGEYSYHPDSPLQRDGVSLFTEALTPLVCTLNAVKPGSQITAAQCLQRYSHTLGNELRGYIVRDVSQLQLTATKVFGSVFGSDSTGFISEVAISHVHNMPDQSVTPLDSPGSGLADSTSWGYQSSVWFDYNNAIGAAKLTPYIRFRHDVSGSSPGPSGQFIDNRKVFTLGVSMNYLERWIGNISYTMHSGSENQLSDRDFISLSLSRSF